MTATAEFEALYTEYRSKVLAYIRSHISDSADAEDLCADVFEKALRRWDDYDPARAAPGTWLYAITRNTVIDYYRRIRPTEELPEELSELSTDDTNDLITTVAVISGFSRLMAEKLLLLEGKDLTNGGSIELHRSSEGE